MHFAGGFYQQPRRGAGPVAALLMGLLGALIGGALVYALFVFSILQLSPLPPFEPEPGPADREPPPYRQDLAVVDVVSRVMPAVVGVNRHQYVTRFGQQTLVQSGSGSGVVITTDGYIVTNHHVVDGADVIMVVFSNSESYQARLVGKDSRTDLALLKIDPPHQLTSIPLGDSGKVRVGETVLAIGNPLGFFQQTVTAGIISALERQVDLTDSDYSHTFIQTDAGINRGNSGGPLVNLRGEMIGINSAKVSQLGVEGIGFAIPSNTVERVTSDLMKHGKVRRSMLGVLPQDLSRHTGVPSDRGVHIREVVKGSAAEASGIQAGDVIIAIGEKEINYQAQLFDALLFYYPGETITVTVRRGDKVIVFTATLGEM
jgi:S1-C subfamily serine protease